MMERPVRKHVRLKHYDYNQNGGYFITICTKGRIPFFWEGDRLSAAGIIARTCAEEISDHFPEIVVDLYCIMPDHVHFLFMAVGTPYMASAHSNPTISKVVQQYKAAVSRRIGRPVWQRSFYDHIIRNQTDLEETRRYIAQNPLKRMNSNG